MARAMNTRGAHVLREGNGVTPTGRAGSNADTAAGAKLGGIATKATGVGKGATSTKDVTKGAARRTGTSNGTGTATGSKIGGRVAGNRRR